MHCCKCFTSLEQSVHLVTVGRHQTFHCNGSANQFPILESPTCQSFAFPVDFGIGHALCSACHVTKDGLPSTRIVTPKLVFILLSNQAHLFENAVQVSVLWTICRHLHGKALECTWHDLMQGASLLTAKWDLTCVATFKSSQGKMTWKESFKYCNARAQ